MSEKRWDASVLTSGGRSALRRCAGRMMDGADAGAQMAFYRAWRGGEKGRACAFAALCMQMLWRETDHPKARPMEEILSDMIRAGTGEENGGLLDRVRAALDTRWADDGFLLGKICNLARMIRAAHPEWIPDFERLAGDMRGWNDEGRRVQRRWVRAIFAGARAEAENEEDGGGN